MPSTRDKDSGSPFGDQRLQLLWLILGVIMMLWILATYLGQGVQAIHIPYSEFKAMIRQEAFQEVILRSSTVRGLAKTGKDEPSNMYEAVKPDDPDLLRESEAHKIRYRVEAQNPWIMYVLSWVVPIVLLFFLWRFFIGWMGGADRGLMAIRRSKAKVYMKRDIEMTFNVVAGVDEAKEELREIIDFLREPVKYRRFGGKIPKGVLLVEPGTGKTLLAKAVAGEAHVPFLSLSGSEFIEMFVGVGAARVRDLFAQAQEHAPCIIFIDEIDALGKVRSIAPVSGGHEEREHTLQQLLVEMDGFDSRKGVIIMAATNRPEILDPALLRPGRFDRHILVDRPDIRGREEILRVHCRLVTLAADSGDRRGG